jgi:putative ABC transport system permease protein
MKRLDFGRIKRGSPLRLNTLGIAAINIINARFRSVCIIALIAMTTLLLSGGTLLGISLENGVDSITSRLGADAMIVPLQADTSFEGALLGGVPSTFYLAAEAAERIAGTDGVERSSPQLFVSTFDSEHCAALVQVVGYDPETDFVVSPWLAESRIAEPGYGEVVVGGNIKNIKIGGNMPVFAVKLKVVGILEKTGMGFDNSIFVNMETARMLLGEYGKFAGAAPLPEGLGTDDVISAVMVDLSPDADSLEFQRSVNLNYRDLNLRVIMSQALLASTSKNLSLVTGILTALLSAIWVFSVFVLAIMFTVALNERRREFGVLRVIGATAGKLSAIVLTEAALLCAVGAFVGIGIVCLIVFPYGALFERLMQTAFLPPEGWTIAALLIGGFLLGVAIGPLSALFSVARIMRRDAFVNLREGL